MKKQSGFTLIELLIVIAMIGILAAVVVPVVTGQTSYAGDGTHCVGGMKFNTNTGVQVIGPNGGGVACEGQ